MAFAISGYNILIEQEKTMTLDRLIKQLQVIREQTGRGDLQVTSITTKRPLTND